MIWENCSRRLLKVSSVSLDRWTAFAPTRISERFYRADPPGSRADGGRGLGLAFVGHLVVAHGGSLFALAAMLGVPVDMTLMGNAQPLRFAKSASTWRIEPLMRQRAVDGGAALA